jgi:hypothetical protein
MNDCNSFSFGVDSDGNSGNNNALILSLYLIDSEDDLLHVGSQPNNDLDGNCHARKRALLYQRLCKACAIANGVLRSSSSASNDVGKLGADGKQSNPKTNHRPWSSGGDGPIFGIHCDINSDKYFINATNDIDGDDMWQSQTPPNHQPEHPSDDEINDTRRMQQSDQFQHQQPHLRAICQYGNDVNDMWRCIALVLRISSVLSSSQSEDRYNLTCAVECWDVNDGHIILIEAAEYLPSWVDDDTLQGGVGGPAGCRNRCWVVDGKVHLIPPSKGVNAPSCNSSEPVKLSRDSALFILMQSIKMKGEGSHPTAASGAVQRAIQDRIDRTNYSHSRVNADTLSQGATNVPSTDNPHWHIAATALPASVARFIQNHPSLVPMLVDSFCANAPELQRKTVEEKGSKGATEAVNGDRTLDGESSLTIKSQPENTILRPTTESSIHPLGNSFPYEQIVMIPIVLTRTNYAELVTGRGVVPSFPIPSAYRSVELNRFQRHLRQSDFGGDSLADEKQGRRNPFQRAVDVGIRLCAGLDWILSNTNTDDRKVSNSMTILNVEDSAIDSLGEVDRRLRIYWTRIDAEASGRYEQSDKSSALPWIEQAWKVGPNGSGIQNAEIDTTLLQALEPMSRCHVFNPELCQPLRKAPCPYTRPGVSLLEIVRSGIKSALKWQRQEFNEDSFPMPKTTDMDDDSWMEVNSLEELEEEMKTLSSRKVNADSDATTTSGRPRRTTRRSRVGRKFARESCEEDEQDAQPKEDAEALNKILAGFRSFVEGEGELEGAVTTCVKDSSQQQESRHRDSSELDPENLMSQEVSIDPRIFLNTLHSMLSNQSTPQPESNPDENHDHISKFFFQEDLDDGDTSDEERGSGFIIDEDTDNSRPPYGPDQDHWSVQNYMVSDKKRQKKYSFWNLPTCTD